MPNNPLIKLYVNQTENRITFRIKVGYYLERLTPEQWNYFEASKLGYLNMELKVCNSPLSCYQK